MRENKMKKFLFLFSCLFLVSCTPVMKKYGNFVDLEKGEHKKGKHSGVIISVDDQKSLAKIVASKIQQSFPVNELVVKVNQEATDPFGKELIEMLKKSGVGIISYNQVYPYGREDVKKVNLNYVIDCINKSNPVMYRITVFIGKDSLSRAYKMIKGDTLYPAGSWVYRRG